MNIIFDASSIEKEITPVHSFGNTLIVGAGPAAIHIAVNISHGWCDRLGMLNRKGSHASRLRRDLEQNHYKLTAKVQSEMYSHLTGEANLEYFYEGFDNVDDIWQTLILCTPSDSYKDIINALQIDLLKKVRTIILISPGIGSNLYINSQLKEVKERIEVISFSSYYAATKLDPRVSNILSVLTKAFKKRIYIASSKNNSTAIHHVKCFVESLTIQCTVLNNTIEAESKNIITYVHPPFFINDFSLNEIFNSTDSQKYMYKIYPEGPITQHTIRTMVLLWKEISKVIQCFGAKPINLLQFLNDDNYPVHEETLSREDIEDFMNFEQTKQEYLLYIRYSSILIDPFSTPNVNGKYFDFSAVPYKQVYKDQNEKWVFPRIPFEDYKRLKLIYGLAQKKDIQMPQTLKLIEFFEKKLYQFLKENDKELSCLGICNDSMQDEIDAIAKSR
ncbi:opine metallophore biosynthesis dehydrogenase [Pelosinus baikalensis]|uniref:Opine metallophore biosynthesis dehydrogenase n=1 Tax=Pelosinus baikalensis TaxID=2892015 RepID=A0ABS8HZI3_9FIRM|nr:opine metallophore biosynthesis dehydrogenase [Pelosinus baikalensis]MCC5468026.1 opine metallophore biosynthesis dehydrogenase [Pelosinus baikalensis]